MTPGKIIDRLRLGESFASGEPPRLGVKTRDGRDAFYCVLEPPRLLTADALRTGIARGVSEGRLAYTSGTTPTIGSDGKFQVNRDKIALGRVIDEDEIDLDSGFVMLPSAVPVAVAPTKRTDEPGGTGSEETPETIGGGTPGTNGGTDSGNRPEATTGKRVIVELVFDATRDQLFKTFPALANLADKSDEGKLTIRIEAHSAAGFDLVWLRNAVEEPFDEAEIERKETD